MTVVVDAETVLGWAFEDTGGDDDLLRRVAEHGALVPTLWCVELADGLLRAEQRGRLTAAEASRFLGLLHSMPVGVDRETPARALGDALALARRHDLSAGDAAYLELAIREGLPLATARPALMNAAGAAGVEVVSPA